ncbi:DNA cytosine methyltransferase [Segatella copri]|uniref:DNA cytosine methyltransferase n=1 Tax=Segatella copri TaxID=165179 RepID=UPI001F3AF089|nr:DNA cytosine methyltransferase [Segatella copri]
MFDEQDRQYFYNEFKNNGYEVGSYDDFKKDLNNEEDRNWYYNEAKNMGYDVGTQADFDKMVLEPAPSTSGGGKQVDASSTTQSVEQKASTETKPQVAQPAKKQETTDKDPGLIAKVLDMIPTGAQTSNGTYQPSPEIPQPVVKGEEMPVKEEASSSSSANAVSPESKEAAPVTTPTGVVNNEGLMDAKLANYLENWKQRPDKQSTYFENLVADLLADGTANSNEEAVSIVKSALGRYANRSAMDVTNQVVSSLPDDTVQDAEKSIEAQWYSHGVQDKLKQEAYNMGISYDDYVGLFLKPAMVQSLVNKYGPKYRDIAEGIATRLYSHDENVQDRLMNQDINDALSSVISKYVNPSVVEEYNKAQEAGSKAFNEGMEGSQFIPANLRLGTALGAQYEANEAKDPAKVLSSLQKKFGRLYRNPEFLNDMSNAAFKVMQRYGLNGTQSSDPKQFKPMINSVLKNELDQLEIKGMMPKGSAEYIMKTGLGNTIVGKITRKVVQTDYQNWLEDIANQQYQPGFWENVASGALTFAGDAWSYWLPGAAGGKLTKSMVAKAEGKLAGDLMAKGMERKMAERAAKVLIGKSKAAALKSGAAHGAVTFGGQSAISKPIDEIYRTGQFDENGKIYNPSVGKVIANTLGEVAKQSAVGAIMQGGTIANMVGKGRGLATNILADIGGKVADSSIMTGQQILERMAHDPNFKPTGKDAAESFLESMANLTAIGLPGMVGKYARFKDAREFNKKFDFTDQDIAELKRFGYDGLRDAFEKVGIGEYAVVGENAQRLDGQLTQKYMDLMNDKSVPEVLKAKMMAVVEGKRPSSFSPIVDSIIVQPMDNNVYLETLNKDGGVVDRKEYSSLDEAQKADKKLEYEKTLGLASVLEGEFHNEFTQEHLDGLYNKAAQKYNMGEKLTDEDKAAVYLHQNAGAIKEIMDKQQKGIILTDEEQKQVNAYRHYYDSALENSSVMREFVNTFEDSHGVARGTLRKALESKDKKYAPLVESYLKELYNSIELKREMKQIEDDKKRIEQGDVDGAKPATPVEGSASVEGSAGGQEPPVSEEPAPYQDRTNSVPTPSDAEVAANPANSAAEGAGNESKVASSDAFVMGQNAYKNGDSEALQAIDYNSDLATGRLKRAFADNEKMPDIVANAYNEGRDMEQFVAQRASLTPAQKEAISKYVEAMDAKKGAIDALQHADDGYGDALKEQLWPYQTEDGNIVPATLDSGKQVFLKKANEYGGAFVVVPDEQGQPMIKQVSNAEIKEVGTPVSLDEYIESSLAQQKDARAQQFISQFDGSGLKPNDQVTVAMEEGDANINMTFAGYSKDGKIVLTDGKDYLPLSKEEFAAWRKNALDNTINEHLDAEDDEREQKAASQADADKKQRYANGIVGLSEGQPDYSSNDTDPNVAAEYLQEQFGEDHGKLLNLVNGSRDDIKTQLANKRKAAIEYQNWLDTNADLDPEKAKKVENELSLVNEQIADLDARFKNWNTIRNSVMTPDEVKAMKEERKAEVEKAGVDESAIVPSDDFHVLVLDDKELKKQYPTMDEATDYITSQRKDIYHTQEDVERKINGVNDMLDQYINGETELDPSQLMELNTTKAQLEALQTNLSVAAKGLKAQANKLSKLYKTEVSKQEMEKLGMTPSEQRKALVADALTKNDMNAIHEIYKDASVDVMDLTPQTLEEAVSESLSPHSLNPESLQYELGKSNFKFGIGKGYDSNKFNYLIAKKGTGMSVNEFAVRVYNDLPVNLQDMGYTDQDVRNALLDMFKSYDSVKEMRNVALMNRIAAAEDELSSEEEYYEAQKEREIIERQAEIEKYKSYIHEKELSLPSEELDHINGLEFDRMMEIEDRDREYKQYVKSILPELADYDDRSNEEGYGGGSSLGSDSSRRGVDEGNSQGEEVGNGEASSESEIGEGSDSGRKGRQETGSMEPGEGSAVRGSHLPQEASFGERLKSAIAETETEPTEAQKKAGNYKKGHLSFGGYDYTVETPKGVTRSGKDDQGKPWSVTMHDTYGYILGKIGVDGDHIDMFINDAADLDTFDGNVYVVDQVNPETGEFDEHKVMYGYPSEEAATEAYLANYSKGWKGLGKVTSVTKATFDKWLESSDRKIKPFAEYAMVQKEQAKFDRDVKEVKPSEMTEAQKVAYDAVSTMLKKAGIPVKVVSNEDMEKVAEAQDNMAVEMLLNDPRLRFYIKTPEQKEAAKAAYDWAAMNRPDKFKQYAIVNMDNPNEPPQYFEKKDLAEKWRKYYTNAWKIGNYKAFNLNKPFEEQIKDVKGDVPSEFDPYKAESLLNKRIELEKQIKETEDSYNAKKKERAEYQNQLMQDYMDQHGLSSENDIPDDVWTDYRDKSFEKYQDTLDDLFHKYVELDNQLKAVAEPGVQYLKGKGVVYGYTDGKEIVLNAEHLNPNTPIHEYQHLWRTAAKKMNPELIEHGDKLIMKTQLFADLKKDPNYNHLTDEQICDEAFARLTGEDGAAILEQMAKDAIKENPLDTAKELSVINKLKEWLKKFWYWTLDTFTKWKPEDIKKMTLEDIRNLVLRDLAQGVDPRTVLKGQMTKDEAVSLRQQMADNAEPERILEHTEDNWLQDFGKDGRVNTPIGSIKLGENQYKKAGREDRIKRFGLLKPTLERPDVILEKPAPKEGAERQTKYLFVKSFKKVDGTKILNFESITVKQGEDEVSISAHQIEPSKLLKELTESKMLWNRFRGDSNSLGENQGSALTPSANNPSGKDSVLNPHSDAKIRNSFEITKENGGNLSVEDKIKAVSQQFGVDEADVAMYANGVKKGSTAEAARARANIKRHLLQANEDKISSFKELLKYTVPVNNALKENFGDLDAMIEERVKQVEAQRNAMEAARKRAEEEEAKRQKHLEELSLIPDDQLDKQYMDALAKGDDATAREMLDEAARRKGYDDTESAYQGVGAWAAPGNPGYESDKARRDDWESSGSDVNLEDMALGYTPQPDDYFSHPERYSQNTPHGLESVKAINTAIDAIKNGEKDVKVKVYRAVPTSVKEGKLRNGDWVTPSKKYADIHGNNRLEGKYRIIEDEVPATQLWWDGNDANEFGFDDGKEYKYKNAKNNRKLNDLVTYDDKGDVIPPSKRFNSRKQDVRFHRVTEPEELERLNKEKTFRMYSGMQEVDGNLYSPMAAIIDGKRTDATEIGAWMGADERPDLVKNGKFQLVKTDKNPGAGEGPVPAAYNPYMHTSTSVMNDQFSGAYARGNIKVVEWEIPESEKTSGYHAVGAKDSVGMVPWTSGTVNSLLPKDRQRSVMLSRWRKAVRIVPDEEVAEKIAAQLSGTGLAIPWNVVTPNQLRELAKLGVPITTVEQGRQNPEVKEKFLAQMDELKKEFPQAQFVDVKMTKEAFKEWGGKGIVKSPIMEQKLQKHPDSLMKAGTYFSGGGLVEEGLKGIIDPVVAVEYDRKISGVYRNNFGQHIVTADVRDVDPKELVKHIDGEVEYFHASPVCKNYSQAKSNSGEVELDKETAKSTADFINAVKPRVVTIENVKGYKDSEAMKIITQALDKNGYKWDADVYNAADYGGYTSRERLIVRAVKDGELPGKPKKQLRKGGWLEAVEDILPTLTVKESGVAPWMDARLKVDGIDWQKVEKPLYVMGSAYADGKIPHAYGDEILPTLRTKSGDVIIMPGGKVLRADGRVLARITGLGDDYKLPKTESLAHTIIGNGIPVQLTQGVIAPLLNKDDLSGRNVLARLGSSIFKNNWDADKQKQVSDRVVNTANKLGGAEATVYTSVDEVPDAYLSDVKNGATGWYDPTTHTVHVYLPNCADANEAERTVLHEKIGHEGMEVLLGGEDGVRKFANFVYNSVAASTRGKILDIANKYDPDWKNPDRMNVGTQEYIAHLAEEGPKTAEDFSLWTKIKHYLIKVLKKLGVRVPGLLNDKDLRYYLMKAGKALHVWDEMPQEKQEAMMKQASNAEIKDALSDGAGKGKPRQKKGESTIQYMKRVQEWRKWQNAREDKENPEPPMFYDIDKDEAGKKEWAQLNKDWRERHHLVGEEPTGMPIRMENEEDDAYMNRIHEYEKWQAAMKDQEDPLPDMFAFEKKKQEEVKRKYEDWLAKHDLLEQQQADLDLYEGKIYPAETNPKADALEQQVMQDLAEVTSTDVSKEGAAMTVKHAVIHRRKNMEEASADDAIYINDVKNRIEKMADSGVFDKLLSDYKGKKNRAEKLAETIPYIIEAPRRLRDMAHNLNATGVFDKGHIHIQPADVEAIQPYVTDLITETAKKHTEIKKGKEIEVYDDPKAVSEVASKMAQAINANHQGEEGFVPCDGTDILSKHVLKLVKERVVPGRINYKELSPEMQAAIDSIRDWYNYTYDWLMDNHTLKAGTGYNVDYVNHIWDKEKSDPEAYATFVENRQRTKSPNEKKRTISTLMEGVYAGLVPKTTDITKMMAYYSRSNIEAWANKTMLQELAGLNVIERNEKGEVISTDPLLSSSAPFNLEQYKYFEIPGVGPVWVYNVSPKQVKVKNPITDNEKVIYSEASAGDRFGVVFDTYQSSPFWKTFDTLASSAKKLELGFSGFHAGALTEVYMVQNMVEFGPKKAMANFMKYIFADTAKNHELPCFANPEDFQEAASHLVKFGATNDYAAADVQNMFDNMRDAMMKVQEKLKDGNKISGTVAKASMPLKVATQMLSLINKGMDVALWDFLHDGLKLATYRMRADKTKERAKKKGWTEEELSRALDEDGQFVNDMFGGQHWDVLGASHRTLRYAGRVLLSPDWNASTTRHFLALTGFGSIWNEATFENFKQYYKRLKHKELTPEDEGRRSRQISALLCYGIGFMVFYEGIANGINAAFRALDEEKERKKAEEIRKTNPSYKSMYELAYGDEGMKWYDYLMRGNSLGQQSKIFLGRYEDGTEMYVRHGKQFREVPEYLFNHKGELEFPGPMVQRMIGKANPMVRMTLDDINYLSDFQASHADQEIQRKYGKTIGLLYKDALYWAPFLIPSQENKEFKAVDFFFPSSKGFSPWKAQSYFKDFILSGDMEGVVMTYQSCQRNGIDPEAQIKAAIGSVKALESAEMSDGVTSLQEASKRFDAAKSITEKKKMRQKMKKFLSQSDYKAFTQKEALDMVQGYLNGDEDLKEMEKAESKYLMKAKAEDVTEDWRIQNVWNGTMETYQEYQRLKDIDKAKANAFKNSKTNKRLFAARKAISAAKKKMNKAKKQMDGTNDAAKLVEIRNTRKELLKTLNGME